MFFSGIYKKIKECYYYEIKHFKFVFEFNNNERFSSYINKLGTHVSNKCCIIYEATKLHP